MTCTQSESTRTPIESSRDKVEEARAWLDKHVGEYWVNDPESGLTFDNAKMLTAYAAHIRTQERERAAKIADDRADKLYDVEGYGILAKRIAAAIREG